MTHLRMAERGQALVEVVIASGILMVATAATFSVLQSQSQETRALNQKVNAIELQRTLTLLMGDSTVCQRMILATPLKITGTTVDKTLPSIPSNSSVGASALITAGEAVSPITPDLKVDKIYFDEVTATATPNQYLAWLRVSFNSSLLVRQIKPLGVRFTLTTDPATGQVNGCINNGSSAPSASSLATSPGGKCTVLQKPMVRGGAGVGGPNQGWSSMAINCPSSFPVAISVNTTPAGYASSWAGHFVTSNPPGYFVAGVCDMMFLRDDPRVTPAEVAAHAGAGIDQGMCSVACCDL